MKKHIRFALCAAVFTLVLCYVLSAINRTLVLKDFLDDTPATSTHLGFYSMEKNSIDVLYLGSSHSYTSIIPQEIYNSYGLRTYNLGTPGQSMILSYYWLEEALRFQSPKAVVLEVLYGFDAGTDISAINMYEPNTRRALDAMKWSDIKRRAVEELCQYSSRLNPMSYYFVNIRFHTRWAELSENDFTYFEMKDRVEMKGYNLRNKQSKIKDYEPFEVGDSQERAKMVPLMEEALYRIAKLCQEKSIPLILLKTPAVEETIQKYNTINDFAQKMGIAFYDFNIKSLYDEIGYELGADNSDTGHANFVGAQKISRKLGQILAEEYHIEPVVDEQWENTRAFYAQMVNNAQLPYVNNVYEYLQKLDPTRHAIFIVTKGEASEVFGNEIVEELNDLGLSVPMEDLYCNSYYGLILPEGISEMTSWERVATRGLFRNGRVTYEVSSAGGESGNTCSIKIDGVEYAKNLRGLNIVVYDIVTKGVIDSVCFDTFDPELIALR